MAHTHHPRQTARGDVVCHARTRGRPIEVRLSFRESAGSSVGCRDHDLNRDGLRQEYRH